MNPDKFRKRRLLEIKVEDMRGAGHTIREIAAETGVSVGTVHGTLRRLEDAEEAQCAREAAQWGYEYTPSRPTVKQVNARQRYRRERNQDV